MVGTAFNFYNAVSYHYWYRSVLLYGTVISRRLSFTVTVCLFQIRLWFAVSQASYWKCSSAEILVEDNCTIFPHPTARCHLSVPNLMTFRASYGVLVVAGQCQVPYCSVLGIVFVVYLTVPYRTYPALPYYTIPYHTIPYGIVPYCFVLYRTVAYCTVPYRTVPYHTIPYRTVPYLTVTVCLFPDPSVICCIRSVLLKM